MIDDRFFHIDDENFFIQRHFKFQKIHHIVWAFRCQKMIKFTWTHSNEHKFRFQFLIFVWRTRENEITINELRRQEFFFDNFMNAFQKNQYLKKIYEKCLLRKIYANTFKKMRNKMIDQAFFKIKTIFLNCKFTSKKMKNYRASIKKHLFFIINFVDDKKKFKFNLNVFRKMNILSFWHSLMKLKKMNLNFRITN